MDTQFGVTAYCLNGPDGGSTDRLRRGGPQALGGPGPSDASLPPALPMSLSPGAPGLGTFWEHSDVASEFRLLFASPQGVTRVRNEFTLAKRVAFMCVCVFHSFHAQTKCLRGAVALFAGRTAKGIQSSASKSRSLWNVHKGRKSYNSSPWIIHKTDTEPRLMNSRLFPLYRGIPLRQRKVCSS